MIFAPTFFAIFVAVSALTDPQLDITYIACSPGQSASCITQCGRNGCPGVYNEASLNQCLASLDDECSVDFEGVLQVTLEKDKDFCQTPMTGKKPPGLLFNVPSMGGDWETMKNPWVILPFDAMKRQGRQCEVLMREWFIMSGSRPADITPRACIDSTPSSYDNHEVIGRSYYFWPEELAYPISVQQWEYAFFMWPAHEQCFAPIDSMKFAVEVKGNMTGGYTLHLPSIVASGTPSAADYAAFRPQPVSAWAY